MDAEYAAAGTNAVDLSIWLDLIVIAFIAAPILVVLGAAWLAWKMIAGIVMFFYEEWFT